MAKRVNYQLFREAKRYIPGGVNSPVRSFKAVGGCPVFIKRARGSKLYDENNREYIDYCLSWGAMILGHSHPEIIRNLKTTIGNGTSFGAATKLETELAKLIVEAVPSIKLLRLTNSGTEAVMGAIRLARAYTKRNKVIKFQGSYHGHADYLLDNAGVPEDFTKHTIVLPYNSAGRLEETVKRHYKDLAAIIVEPVAANCGVISPRQEFLQGLRKISDKYNIVLIFDEVITGFRLSYGGAGEFFKIKPDLICLGKIVGGGLPVGAFGGGEEIMKLLAPEGKVYQAGTFSGNPVTVTAGIATLKILKKENPYEALEKKTENLCERIGLKAQMHKIELKVNRVGSIFSIFFTDKDVKDYNAAKTQNQGIFKKFFHFLLKEGVYLSPSGFEANFSSTAHTAKDIEKTLQAVDRAFKTIIYDYTD